MRLIILDRDGVINEDSDDYIKSPDEYIPIPGSLAAIARLNRAGYTVAVASNQSGIGRGLFDWLTLEAMHIKLTRLLTLEDGNIDGFFICPHRPDENCQCRKPKTGLLEQISEMYHIPLTGVPFIGDSLKDIEVAKAVGAKPILVKTGKGGETVAKGKGLEDVPVYNDLAAAVDALLEA